MLPIDRHGVYAVLVPPEPREILRLCGDELNTAKYGFNICGLARREEAIKRTELRIRNWRIVVLIVLEFRDNLSVLILR